MELLQGFEQPLWNCNNKGDFIKYVMDAVDGWSLWGSSRHLVVASKGVISDHRSDKVSFQTTTVTRCHQGRLGMNIVFE